MPLPEKPLKVPPPVSVISAKLKSVEASLRVKVSVTLGDAPLSVAVELVVTAIVGVDVSMVAESLPGVPATQPGSSVGPVGLVSFTFKAKFAPLAGRVTASTPVKV